jgi:REP element-mobilizing transposase RayT
MKFNHDIHSRHSIRLKGYDYSKNGAYFITICAKNRECLFGKIIDGKMILNEFGRIVYDEWLKTNIIRNNVVLAEFIIVMPNHFHAIFNIDNKNVPVDVSCVVGAYCNTPLRNMPLRNMPLRNMPLRNMPLRNMPLRITFASPSQTVGAIVRGYKSSVTKLINDIRKTPGVPAWQRNYYEHIIRDETEYMRFSEYIINNPLNWASDENNSI